MLTYRDRIGTAAWVVGVLLVVQPVLLAPVWAITWYPLGSPLSLTVDRDTFLGVLLALALVGGTQWVLQGWDTPDIRVRGREGAWALPLALGWLALRLLPRQPHREAWLAVLLGTLLLLALAWHTLVHLFREMKAPYPAAFVWRTLTFGAAGSLYLWLYLLGERSLVAATQMWVGTTLLAAALWLKTPLAPRERWLYSLIVGMMVAQLAWALKQTTLSPLRSGGVLLLVFYLSTSVLERVWTHHLNLRVLVEYLVTGAVALAFILALQP